jgi:hypothetical protein
MARAAMAAVYKTIIRGGNFMKNWQKARDANWRNYATYKIALIIKNYDPIATAFSNFIDKEIEKNNRKKGVYLRFIESLSLTQEQKEQFIKNDIDYNQLDEFLGRYLRN